MAKPFDSATKQLVDLNPAEWLALAGLPIGERITPLDADLATVTTEADRVLRVESDALATPYLAHLEPQTTWKEDMIDRFLRYHVLLRYRYRLPVQTVVLLLRREADGEDVTGRRQWSGPDPADDPTLTFRYHVVRVWQQSVTDLLEGGLATLPLAPISNVARGDLPDVIRAMERRILADATPQEAGILWVSTYTLMGLSYSAAFVQQLLQGVQGMEDSATYQAILAKGRSEGLAEGRTEGHADGERDALLRIGRRRLGEPTAAIAAAIAQITSEERLGQLIDRVVEVETWDELLAP